MKSDKQNLAFNGMQAHAPKKSPTAGNHLGLTAHENYGAGPRVGNNGQCHPVIKNSGLAVKKKPADRA